LMEHTVTFIYSKLIYINILHIWYLGAGGADRPACKVAKRAQVVSHSVITKWVYRSISLASFNKDAFTLQNRRS
jgi:hypothetical protein